MFECIKRLFSKKETPKAPAPVAPKPEPLPPLAAIGIDMELFKENLVKGFAHYRPAQWEGFEIISREFYKQNLKDLRWLAYIFATALHETAFTMKPITEYGGSAYLRSKKYWPFVGRGYVQLTWEYNYVKYGIKDNPEKALDPEFAAFVIVDGMKNGTFTGKYLELYFNDKVDSPYEARRIVNGLDKATEIAEYHKRILWALNESRITGQIERELYLG